MVLPVDSSDLLDGYEGITAPKFQRETLQRFRQLFPSAVIRPLVISDFCHSHTACDWCCQPLSGNSDVILGATDMRTVHAGHHVSSNQTSACEWERGKYSWQLLSLLPVFNSYSFPTLSETITWEFDFMWLPVAFFADRFSTVNGARLISSSHNDTIFRPSWGLVCQTSRLYTLFPGLPIVRSMLWCPNARSSSSLHLLRVDETWSSFSVRPSLML